MTNDQRTRLLKHAGDAALELNKQLNLLLDGYDFAISRWRFEEPSEQLELRELQASIKELATLPRMIAMELDAWSLDEEQTLSRIGFEIHVLNELAIHMHSVAFFLGRRHIDIEPFSLRSVSSAIAVLRATNRLLAAPTKA